MAGCWQWPALLRLITKYHQIEGPRQYLMLSSEEVHAELYTLNELSRWIFTETRDLGAVLDMSNIGCQVPLAAVYAGVESVAMPAE